ncbi:MAG: hypothetical protein ACE5DY_09480 [Mariprofundaceae bacterium]
MEKRTLTVSVDADWQGRLRDVACHAETATTYQGETLNFQRPDEFFSMLTGNRWRLLQALIEAQNSLGVRELARQLQRDVRRVHDDIVVLDRLGLIERTAAGGVTCPFDDVYVDVHVAGAFSKAA